MSGRLLHARPDRDDGIRSFGGTGTVDISVKRMSRGREMSYCRDLRHSSTVSPAVDRKDISPVTPPSQRHTHASPEDLYVPASHEVDDGRRSTRTMVLRAGLVALAMSVAVSGGAYAAVRVGEHGRASGVDAADQRIDALDAEGARNGVSVTPSISTLTAETVDVTDPHGSLQQESGDLPQGETKVATAGIDGVVRTTYEIITVDGKEVSRIPVAQVVVTQKVDEVVLVGTGTTKTQEQSPPQSQAPAPSASSDSSSGGSASNGHGDVGDDVWARLAQCESGGNPKTDTGNGFYGMYQFTLSTWQSLGGTGYPHEADAATQTEMAKRLQAKAGWGQWPACSSKLGLR